MLNKKRISRARKSTNMNNTGFKKLVDGRNVVRVFAFEHTVTKEDFKKGIYRESDGIKVGEAYDEIDREVYRHFTENGVINCPGGNCKWCDESKDLLSSKNKRDQKAGKQLRANRSFYVNLVDMEEIEKGVQICGLPQTVYSEVLAYIEDPEFGESILGIDGRDIIIERDSKESPQNMYTVKLRDEKRSEKLEGDFNVVDLFEMSALEPGWSSDEDLNMYDKGSPDDDETTTEEKSKSEERVIPKKKTMSEKEEKEKNPFKDEDAESPKSRKRTSSDDDKLPWEKNDEIGLGDIVSFTDDGEDYDGRVIEIDDKNAAVQTGENDSDIFDIPVDELKLVQKNKPETTKKGSARRRS